MYLLCYTIQNWFFLCKYLRYLRVAPTRGFDPQTVWREYIGMRPTQLVLSSTKILICINVDRCTYVAWVDHVFWFKKRINVRTISLAGFKTPPLWSRKRREIKYGVLSHRFDKHGDRRHQRCIVKMMLVFVRYLIFIPAVIAATIIQNWNI